MRFFVLQFWSLPHSREIDSKRRTVSQLAVGHDVAIVLLHHAIYRGQSKPGSSSFHFRCEERLKNPRHGLRTHSGAGVTDYEHEKIAGLSAQMLSRISFVQLDTCRFQNEFSTARHSIACVHSQIHEDLFELRWIDFDIAGVWLKVNRQFDIFADQLFQQLLNIPNDSIGVDHARLNELLTAKRQQLLREFCCAASRLLD